MLEMQKRNVVWAADAFKGDEEEEMPLSVEEGRIRKARMREECMFGSLADVRLCLDYFKMKPALNIIDKRLLLGVF